MELKHPKKRGDYEEHLKDLGNTCAFCSMDSSLNIDASDYWIWVYSAFPYRKYHSLLVSKRHLNKFSELNNEELLDLTNMLDKIEKKYRSSNLVSKSSEFGDQLYFAWRSREKDEHKPAVAHFHLHIYPKFATEDDLPLHENAWDINLNYLRE